ncbi:MAG: chorismate-binding protein [Flavobacteriales bacterium]|nr:chorismate-binding protein [Flavobacteriales bacterium]
MVLDQETSFACYSQPGSSDFNLVQGEITTINASNWPSASGFIISTFYAAGSYFFLAGDSLDKNPEFTFNGSSCFKSNILTKQHYLELCNSYIEKCQDEIEKIILSRVKKVTSKHHASTIFHALRKAYPDAFVYLFNSPITGTWIGASPETFLKRDHQSFTTMALAGTQTKKATYYWEIKETNEQGLVTQFIHDQLKSLGIMAKTNGPYTKEAANIAHLRTDFNFETEVSPQNIIQALHPTPAVCGIPRETTQTIIQKNEPHDRELYCGFLGPVNFNNQDELYVNLRCLKLNLEELYLFVGGGITSESDAEKEWDETEAKAQTLLGVIENL